MRGKNEIWLRHATSWVLKKPFPYKLRSFLSIVSEEYTVSMDKKIPKHSEYKKETRSERKDGLQKGKPTRISVGKIFLKDKALHTTYWLNDRPTEWLRIDILVIVYVWHVATKNQYYPSCRLLLIHTAKLETERDKTPLLYSKRRIKRTNRRKNALLADCFVFFRLKRII